MNSRDSEDPFLRSTSADPSERLELPDDLLSELDKALENLTADFDVGNPPLEMKTEESQGLSGDVGVRQMQETFLEMAAQSLAPVDRYMKAIGQGEVERELLEISELVVTSLIPRTQEVGLSDHAEELSFFRSILLLALGETDPTGLRAMTEVVMESFTKLAFRFSLTYRGYRPAVRNLVMFYRAMKSSEGIGETETRRFFAIGVPSLTWVRRTKVSELSSLSGIAPEVMTEIRKVAYAYRAMPMMGSARLAREDVRAPEPMRPVMLTHDVGSSEALEADVTDPAHDSSPAAVRGQS